MAKDAYYNLLNKRKQFLSWADFCWTIVFQSELPYMSILSRMESMNIDVSYFVEKTLKLIEIEKNAEVEESFQLQVHYIGILTNVEHFIRKGTCSSWCIRNYF